MIQPFNSRETIKITVDAPPLNQMIYAQKFRIEVDVLSEIIKIGKEINYNTYMLDVDEFISTGNLNFNRLTFKFVKEKKTGKPTLQGTYLSC